MKCQAPIDPKTGIALEGDALQAALRDPKSPRCGYAIEDDDVFCPSCGVRVERGQRTAYKGGEGVAAEEGVATGATDRMISPAVTVEATRRFLDLCRDYQHEEAARFVNSIDRENAEIQFCLGEMYRYGWGVSENATEAVEWYRKAATQGLAEAQNALGEMYEYGRGVETDEVEAVKWFRKAAKQGFADAQCNLGEAYEMGWGVKEDEASAAKWFRKAAANGNEDACDALKRLENRAKDNAEINVAEMELVPPKGTGHDDDSVLKEVGGGVVKAVSGIISSVSGLISIAFTLIVGVWLYGAFCAHNDVEHHQSLGVVLQRMYGTEYNPLTRHGYRMYIKHFTTTSPDEKPTKEELGKRLESTVKETVEDLGAFFDDKKNLPRNRALYRLRENLADAAGNASRGRGNASDGVKSALGKFLLDELSDADNSDDDDSKTAEQLLEIGVRYLTGNGVTKDARKAFEYSRKAAEKDNAMAQCNLGYCYENGVGVERNWIEAMKWYRKAADNGNETAKNKLKQIEGLGKP